MRGGQKHEALGRFFLYMFTHTKHSNENGMLWSKYEETKNKTFKKSNTYTGCGERERSLFCIKTTLQ